MPSVLAVAAHPDDIEFVMAGTMLMLGRQGWDLHYLNVAHGNYGSTEMTAAETEKVRRGEAKAAAKLLGAKWYSSFCDDLGIFYTEDNLRRICAVIREAQPSIILTHALADYMEDHMITARLVVTAAFARGIPNYKSRPKRTPVAGSCLIYHAMPHGQQTPMREPVEPEITIDTTDVHELKREALSCHVSQKEWLDETQGMDCYLETMDAFSRRLGQQSRRFKHAEGWRRHLHYGFTPSPADDPLSAALGKSALRRTGKV